MITTRSFFLMLGGGILAVLVLRLITAPVFNWSPPVAMEVVVAFLGVLGGSLLGGSPVAIRRKSGAVIPDLCVPIDMYKEDPVGSKAAFRIIEDGMWSGTDLAVKRMFRIGTGPQARVATCEFGVIREPGEPVRIHVNQQDFVYEFETIKAMLQYGWTLD